MRLLLLAAALSLGTAHAQVAVGGQLGDPTGLALKIGSGPGTVLLGVGWDLGDSVSAEGHYLLRSGRVRGSGSDVRFFYGPGVFLQASDSRDTRFGISAGLGLETLLTPDLEIFGLISPRLRLIESTDLDLGAALGLRFRL